MMTHDQLVALVKTLYAAAHEGEQRITFLESALAYARAIRQAMSRQSAAIDDTCLDDDQPAEETIDTVLGIIAVGVGTQD
jgi:hypothetical protein